MCLGLPMKIIKINGMEAIAETSGIKNKIRVDLLSNIKEGDYVMVHAGFGIEVIDKSTAEDTLEAIIEVNNALSVEMENRIDKQ